MSSVEESGSGPDLVLLHGWGTNPHVWRELKKLLAARFRVHAPALPFGSGSDADGGETLERIADHVARRAPGLCAVCGWSLGGAVALAWAHRAPRQVSRLALIGTNSCFVQRADWPHALEPRAVQDFARGLVREPAAVLTRYIALQASGDARATRVARHLRQTLLHQRGEPDTAALQLGLSLLAQVDLRSALPQIPQPALVVHGARDAVVPLPAGEYLAQALPNARLVVMADAAHAPFASDPEGMSTQLSDFFE